MTETPDTTHTDDDSLDLPQNLEAAKRLRNEARNLRERLRAMESDHESALTQLEAMRHAEVQRIAAEHLVDPGDIWTSPADVSALVDEHGVVDSAKVTDAAKALLSEKPHLAKDYRPAVAKPPSERPIEGLRAGATPSDYTPDPKPTWADAIKSRVGPPRRPATLE